MFPVLDIARTVRISTLALLCGSVLCLAGCDDKSGDPAAQIGPHPNLPPPTQYLVPRQHRLAGRIGPVVEPPGLLPRKV
jgi:hypothetical protein